MVWKLTAAVSLATLGVRGLRTARTRAYARGYNRGFLSCAVALAMGTGSTTNKETQQ